MSYLNHDYVECSCEDPAHVIRITSIAKKNDEPYTNLMTVEINMAHHRNWWQRLKTGLKYIFGRGESNYGDYAEILLNEENVRDLKALCELHLEDLERNRRTSPDVYDKLFEEYNAINTTEDKDKTVYTF